MNETASPYAYSRPEKSFPTHCLYASTRPRIQAPGIIIHNLPVMTVRSLLPTL